MSKVTTGSACHSTLTNHPIPADDDQYRVMYITPAAVRRARQT